MQYLRKQVNSAERAVILLRKQGEETGFDSCSETTSSGLQTPLILNKSKDTTEQRRHSTSTEVKSENVWPTRPHELVVGVGPGLLALAQPLLHGFDVGKGAVALRELGGAAAPAVVVAAQELALRVTRHIAEGRLHEAVPQEFGQHILQSCEPTQGWRGVVRGKESASLVM